MLNKPYYRKYKNKDLEEALLHQYIWAQAHGPIPAGHVIHHLDGNPFNNSINNLHAMEKTAHLAYHKLGTHHTLEQKRKLSERMKNNKNYLSRKSFKRSEFDKQLTHRKFMQNKLRKYLGLN